MTAPDVRNPARGRAAVAALAMAVAVAFVFIFAARSVVAYAEGDGGGQDGAQDTTQEQSTEPQSSSDDDTVGIGLTSGSNSADNSDTADGSDDEAQQKDDHESTVFPGGNADETLADGSTSVQLTPGEQVEEDEQALRKDNLVNLHQLPDSSFIYDTLIADLATADSYLNNQTVQVVGEVIGDRITSEFDASYCWIALQSLDQPYSQISVYMTKVQADPIDVYGAYGARGTTLQVRGTFHLTCPDHQGLTDLHADNVTVVSKGEVIEQTLNPVRFVPGVILIVVGLALLLVFRRIQERRR